MSDDYLVESLSSEAKDTSDKVARRFMASTSKRILRGIVGELKKMRAWAETFPQTLRDSKDESADAPKGYVWQDEWVDFWTPFDPIQRRLFRLGDTLERIDQDLADEVDPYLEPTRAARIDEAISDPKFAKRDGKDHISYSEKGLREWHKAFDWWINYAIKSVEDLQKSALRS